MKINAIASPSFKNVYGIYGSKSKINNAYDELCNIDNQKTNIVLIPVTDVYVKRQGFGILTNAAKRGDDIAFFVAGAKDCKLATHIEEDSNEIIEELSRKLCDAYDATLMSDEQKATIFDSMA